MAKIPFDIKFRPQIESGEYKVVTGDNRPVRIISWDKKVFGGRFEIVALVPTSQGDTETVQLYCPDGTLLASNWNEKFKLFIITPEPELTEFEQEVRVCVTKNLTTYIKDGNGREMSCTVFMDDDTAKKMATELLDFARKEFVKQGYVIEKKAFHDAVEKIDDKHKAAISVEYSLHCKVENGIRHAVMNWNEFQKVAQYFIDFGKAEALKELPRWKIWQNGACGNGEGRPIALIKTYRGYKLSDCLGVSGEKYIMLSDLEKLPGFKEDEK